MPSELFNSTSSSSSRPPSPLVNDMLTGMDSDIPQSMRAGSSRSEKETVIVEAEPSRSLSSSEAALGT